MPRSVLADEDILQPYVESLLRCRATFEIGLLIGRPATSAGGRDYLVGHVRAPPQVGGDNSRRSATYPVDAEWISEHGRQLSRMLPGGLAVLGAYVYVPDAIFKSKLPEVVHALQALKEACAPATCRCAPSSSAPTAGKGAAGAWDGADEMLALHISAETGKFTAKSCTAQEARACEFKAGKVLASFTPVTAGYQVELSLPILAPSAATATPGSSAKKVAAAAVRRTLRSQVDRLLAQEEARLRDAVVAVGEVVPGDSEQVLAVVEQQQAACEQHAATASSKQASSQKKAAPASSPLERALPLQVFAALPSAVSSDDWKLAMSRGGEEGSLEGRVELRGNVRALAYVHNREPFGRAADSLKADILSTLRARLDVLSDELERRAEEEEEEERARDRTKEGCEAGDQPVGHKGAGYGRGGAGGTVGGQGTSTAPSKLQHPLLATVQQLNVLSQPLFFALPRRALVAFRGGLLFCDYLLDQERLEDVEERCREVLDLEAATDLEATESSVVKWIEGVPKDNLGREQAGAGGPPSSSEDMPSLKGRSRGFIVAAAGAVGVAIAAMATTFGLEYFELSDVL